MTTLSLTVNGRAVAKPVEPRTHLADFLREQQDLTGTHLGCEHGVCGACTLLIDGVPARSCITYAVACEGAEITTIEGLDADEIATELRAAFTREHALQCGFCTPGMMVAARDLVLRLADDNEAAIRNAMSGNLCRCTGYVGITKAIRAVIVNRRERGIAPLRGGGRSALGPAGSGHGVADNGTTTAVTPKPLRVAPVHDSATTQAAATMLAADWTPSATFERAFTMDQPRDKVWALFNDTSAVAACLPGVALDGEPDDNDIRGHMRVKLGPIAAAFQGMARITRDAQNFSGVIDGSGQDRRSNSSTRGRIVYCLTPEQDGAATRVDLTIGFALTGMLAQFSRSGLVQSLMDRIIATFVDNLKARLDGTASGPAAPDQNELKISGLMWATLAAQIKALRAKIFGG